MIQRQRRQMACFLSAALFVTMGSLAASTIASVVVEDGFESADFKYAENGFSWGSPNRTSIVRDDGYVVNNGSPVMLGPYPDRRWENAASSSGRHAIRFRYAAGADTAEQQFRLNTAYPEIWVRFALRVPVNFQHGSTAPSNNKLFMFWMDNYSTKGDGSTVGMEYRNDGSGGSNFYVKVSPGRYSVLGGDQGSVSFIRYPSDQGRWMQIVVRIRAESTPDSKDGIVQVWRKWEGETQFTQTHDRGGQPIRIPSAGPAGFSAGYLMGWANTKYAVDTEFLLDDFTVATSSLLETTPTPKPPSGVIVE